MSLGMQCKICPRVSMEDSAYCPEHWPQAIMQEFSPKEVAKRFNTGKMRFTMIPPEWLQDLGSIFEFGAQKYSRDNWKNSVNTDDHDSFRQDRLDSAFRHFLAYLGGEERDKESDEPHLSMASWNLLAVRYYDIHHNLPPKGGV